MLHLVIDRCTDCGAKLTEADLDSGVLESYSYCLCRSCVKRMRRRVEARRRIKSLRRRIVGGISIRGVHRLLIRRVSVRVALLLPSFVFAVGLFIIAIFIHLNSDSENRCLKKERLIGYRLPTLRIRVPKDRMVELLERRKKTQELLKKQKEEIPEENRLKGKAVKPPTRGSELPLLEHQTVTEKRVDTGSSRLHGAEAMRWKTEKPKSLQPVVLKRRTLRLRVDKAIERGIEWLLSSQRRNGSFCKKYKEQYPMGKTAICVYALLSAGQKPDSKEIQKAFQYLSELPMQTTYGVSLLLLAIDALLKQSVMKEGRLPKKWRTEAAKKFKESPQRLRNLAESAAKWLIEAQIQNGLWSYSKAPHRLSGGDMSNTQFALLALDAALRLKIPVPKEVFEKSLRWLLRNQQIDGKRLGKPFYVPAAELSLRKIKTYDSKKQRSRKTVVKAMLIRGFSYKEGPFPPYPYLTMTAAGLAGLVICKKALEQTNSYSRYRKKCNAAIRDAAAYIAEFFSINRGRHPRRRIRPLHGGNGWGDYYHLYSIERAGVMAMVENFGEHNWYREGAEAILRAQMKNGSWESSPVDTAFALLFLAKAVVPPADVIYTGEGLLPKKNIDWFKPKKRNEKASKSDSQNESVPEKMPDKREIGLAPAPRVKGGTMIERRVAQEVNKERVARGLSRLRWSDGIGDIMRGHAWDCLRFNYFGHGSSTNPNASFVSERAKLLGIPVPVENGYRGAYTEAVKAWLNSPGHRANLLSPSHRFHGVGTSPDGKIVFWGASSTEK